MAAAGGGGEGAGAAGWVVYVGHVPHGFYEKQMMGYFSQFGELLRVRLSRSRRTGRSKHYAFLEFKSPEVAAIAAEAMDGYLMMKQKLECHVVPPEKVHPQTFAGANRRFKKVPWQKLARERHNRARTPEEGAKLLKSLEKKERKRKQRIEAEGMDYEYEGYAEQLARRAGRGTGEGIPAKAAAAQEKKQAKARTKAKAVKGAEAVEPSRRSSKRAKATPSSDIKAEAGDGKGTGSKEEVAKTPKATRKGTGSKEEVAKTPKATRKAPKTPGSRAAKAVPETPATGSQEKKKKLTPRSQYRTKLRPRRPKASS